jgi:hypothetical protein
VVQSIVSRSAPWVALGVSALGSLGLLAWFIYDTAIAMDFGVYWRAANEPLEMAYLQRKFLNFPYPPTMLLWVAPLSLIPMWAGYVVWVALSAGAFLLACRQHLSRREIAVALISMPVVYCLLNGQVAVLLTALLLWACSTRNRVTAGIALAIIASIKPQFVLLAPLLLVVTKDWRAILSSAVAFNLILAASVMAFGFKTWAAWLAMLDHFNMIVAKNGVLMVVITPAGVAERWGLTQVPFLVAGAAFGSWVIVKCRGLDPLHKATAVSAGSLLAAPYAIIYDLTAVVPFLVWCAFRGQIVAALALSGGLNPLPLVVAAWGLGHSRPTNCRPAQWVAVTSR